MTLIKAQFLLSCVYNYNIVVLECTLCNFLSFVLSQTKSFPFYQENTYLIFVAHTSCSTHKDLTLPQECCKNISNQLNSKALTLNDYDAICCLPCNLQRHLLFYYNNAVHFCRILLNFCSLKAMEGSH